MNDMNVKPIGIIHSPHKTAKGIPIQPKFAAGVKGTVEVFGPYADALKDLDGFERIWLLYWFHKAPPASLHVTPFMDTVGRGLFSTRAPCRPNPIGISAVRLVKIEGGILHVEDVDILDGTPLLDIKPYVPRFDHYDVARIGWLSNAAGRPIADERFVED